MPKIIKNDIIVLDLETQNSFDDVGDRHNLDKLQISLAGDAFLKKRQVDIHEVEGGYFHAFCHLRKEVRMFGMDRVTSFKVLDEKYQVPEEW